MNTKISICLVIAALLSTASFAEAQQTGKVAGIVSLTQALLLGARFFGRRSDKNYVSLSGLRGKISPFIVALRNKRVIGYPRLRRNWLV